MKAKLLTIGLSTVLISMLISSLAYASWTTLGTGYAVTSSAVGPVASGTPVTITAGTLDDQVTQVTFKWYGPPGADNLVFEETVVVFTNGTVGYWDEGTPAEKEAIIKYAQSTYTPYHGEWRVEVIFHSQREGFTLNMPIEITQSQSLFVIPEISFGTIGAIGAMAMALGLFIVKKRRTTK